METQKSGGVVRGMVGRIMDTKEKNRLKQSRWTVKNRERRRVYMRRWMKKYREDQKLKPITFSPVIPKEGHCKRCGILFKYEEAGDETHCGGCLNEMGVI